jgi:hypothetical protein
MDSIQRTMAARAELYGAARLAIDTTTLSLDQVVGRIVKALKAAERDASR